ncbi:SET domain-containing protein 3 [Basidiobolus ranarum]|uniref:SET domain-containing protein 3 n=1 Tax=Basidiobolus ranarum TaxID=34480 RepID=A0ABR2WWL1_9FUNG
MDTTTTPFLTDASSHSSLSSLSIENQENSAKYNCFQNSPPNATRERNLTKVDPVTSPFKTIKSADSFIIPRPRPLLGLTAFEQRSLKHPLVPTSNSCKKRSQFKDRKGKLSEHAKNGIPNSHEAVASLNVHKKSHLIDRHLNTAHISLNKILSQYPTNKNSIAIPLDASPITVSAPTHLLHTAYSNATNGLRLTLVNAFKRIKTNYTPTTKKHSYYSRKITIIEPPRMIISKNLLIIGSSDKNFQKDTLKKTFKKHSFPQSGVSKFRIGGQGKKLRKSHLKRKPAYSLEMFTPFLYSDCKKTYKTSKDSKNHRCSGKTNNIVDCICDHDYSDTGTMILCDLCQNWLHISCVKISENNLPDKYVCPRCTPKTNIHHSSNNINVIKTGMPLAMSTSDAPTEDSLYSDIYHDSFQSSQVDLATDPFDSDGELPLFENTAPSVAATETDQIQSLLLENDEDMYMLFSDIPQFDDTDVLSSDVNGLVLEPYVRHDDAYRKFVSKPSAVRTDINMGLYIDSMATELRSDLFSDTARLDDSLSAQVYATPALTRYGTAISTVVHSPS